MGTCVPLMDLRMFTGPCFSSMKVLFSVVGVGFLLAICLGQAEQLTPLGIAPYVAIKPDTSFITAPLVGRILGNIRGDVALTLALLLVAMCPFAIGRADEASTYLDLVWHLMIFGVSIALMFGSVAAVTANSVPLKQAATPGATNGAATDLRRAGPSDTSGVDDAGGVPHVPSDGGGVSDRVGVYLFGAQLRDGIQGTESAVDEMEVCAHDVRTGHHSPRC